MPVWFVYRCHYNLPGTKFVKRFPEETILEWFRNHCQPILDRDEAIRYSDNLFGTYIRGFAYFLNQLDVPPPKNNRQLRAAFNCWSVEGEWLFQEHAIEGLDDDDEEEQAYYIFDGEFAARYPERVAWLMREGWELPTDAGNGPFKPAFGSIRRKSRGKREGATWLLFFVVRDSSNLSDLNAESYRIDNVRLPRLARWLSGCTESEREEFDWCGDLHDLADEILADIPVSDPMEQVFLNELRAHPTGDHPWDVYGDWLEEHGRPRAELWLLEQAIARIGKRPLHLHPPGSAPADTPNLSQWRIAPHVAQLSLHKGTAWKNNCFDHWVLFDDLWASAHPDLANSLIRQLDRWDVLAPPRRARR
jgi:uncharacterized protein (TIGR02996 family)